MRILKHFTIAAIICLLALPAFAKTDLGVFYAQYGTAKVIYLTFEDGATTDNYIGTDFAAGDCKISKDGGAVASTTNLPSQITGSQPHYSFTLTATEMQATTALITCTDASASAWKDVSFRVETTMTMSKLVIDATNGPTNAHAMTLQGNGTGAGLLTTGGTSAGNGITATGGTGNGHGAYFTGSGASAALHLTGGPTGPGLRADGGATSGSGAEFYGTGTQANGIYALAQAAGAGIRAETTTSGVGISAVGGATGIGIKGYGGTVSGSGMEIVAAGGNSNGLTIQGQGAAHGVSITAGATGNGFNTVGGATSGYGFYTAGQTAAQGHNIFAVPYVDISAAPAAGTTSFSEAMGALVGRFYNKVTQTSTLQTIYKSDSTTVGCTKATSDNGTTQTLAKCQ